MGASIVTNPKGSVLVMVDVEGVGGKSYAKIDGFERVIDFG